MTQRNSLKEEEWFRNITLEESSKGEINAEECVEMQAQRKGDREAKEDDAGGGNAEPTKEKPEPQQQPRTERRRELKPDSSADQKGERETPREGHATFLKKRG
ncbi:hypothetical protein NDU88_006317 [Pleurodeles waltl]|uniref:Uncharacterized protein n=1 Tax=Pleurodeles waltl TaxID=8319 RepID=A0AAV7UKM5_PLEWA|nr:hypothetical protein NDU88_006317 [Pleurodeles waltl]